MTEIDDGPQEKFLNWVRKINFFKNQINKLEKELEENHTLIIAIFLLKTQVVEFELKQFINSVDLWIHFHTSSGFAKFKIRYPIYFDKYSMGSVVKVLSNYESSDFKDLISIMDKLVKHRNHFTHHLLDNSESIDEAFKSAKQGIKIANEALSEIDKIISKIEYIKYINVVKMDNKV